jgi:hypothetical protein
MSNDHAFDPHSQRVISSVTSEAALLSCLLRGHAGGQWLQASPFRPDLSY